MQNLIATTFEVVHYIALQAVHYKPLQEVHLSRYNHIPRLYNALMNQKHTYNVLCCYMHHQVHLAEHSDKKPFNSFAIEFKGPFKFTL